MAGVNGMVLVHVAENVCEYFMCCSTCSKFASDKAQYRYNRRYGSIVAYLGIFVTVMPFQSGATI